MTGGVAVGVLANASVGIQVCNTLSTSGCTSGCVITGTNTSMQVL